MDVPPVARYGAVAFIEVSFHDVYDPNIEMTYTRFETTIWMDDGRVNWIPLRFEAWFINYEGELFGPLRSGDGGPMARYGTITYIEGSFHNVYDPNIEMTYSWYEAILWMDDGCVDWIPLRFKAWFINYEGELFGPLRFGDGGPRARTGGA